MMPNLQPMSRARSPAIPRQHWPRPVCTRLATRLAAAAIVALTCASSHAATITVNTTQGGGVTINGNCSLAEATVAANFNIPVDTCAAGLGLDTIAFATSIFSPTAPFAATITLQQRLNLADDGVTIEPPPGKSLIISGGGSNGLFVVTKGLQIFRRLTLNGGNSVEGGGAILINSPAENVSVELDRVSATNNTGSGPGGAVGGTVGVGDVELSVRTSSFTSNTSASPIAQVGGGAIGFDVSSAGELFVIIENSVLSFNTGVGANGGALALRQNGNSSLIGLTVTNSVFNNNSALSGGAVSLYNASDSNFFVGEIFASRFSANIGSAGTSVPGVGAIEAVGPAESASIGNKLKLRSNSFVGNTTDNGVGAVQIVNLGSELINNLFANNVGVTAVGGLRLDYDGTGNQFTTGEAVLRANTFFENSGDPKDLRLDMPLIGLPGAGRSEYIANVVQGTPGGNSNCAINNVPSSSYNAANLGGANCAPGAGSVLNTALMISLAPVTHFSHTQAAIPAAASPVVDLWPDSECNLDSGSAPAPLNNDMLGLRRDVATGLPPDGNGDTVHDCDAGSIEIEFGAPPPNAIFADGFE